MKRQLKTALQMLVLLFVIASLTGCWNSVELNTLAIVQGIGIDKSTVAG